MNAVDRASLPPRVLSVLDDMQDYVEVRVVNACAAALREGIDLPSFATTPWTLGGIYRRLDHMQYPTPRVLPHGTYVDIFTPLGIRRLHSVPELANSGDDTLVVLASAPSQLASEGPYEQLIKAAEALMELAQRFRA